MSDLSTMPRGRDWLNRLVKTAMYLAIIFVMGVMGAWVTVAWKVTSVSNRLPEFSALRAVPGGQTIRIYANDGTLIHSEGGLEGQWIAYNDIPVVMRKAMISIEDRRYLEHNGVDLKALARVAWYAWENRGTDRRLQGASTITQQAARLIFLSRDYSFRRKIDEAIVALAMERIYSKEQILELYLNRSYFGGGAYGLDAATRIFFNHKATEISVAEAALIAGLVKAPSNYSPSADPEAAIERSHVVLAAMARERAAPPAAIAAAKRTPPKFEGEETPVRNSTRYFVDWILPQAKMMINDDMRGIDIMTTLDLKVQTAAEKAIEANAPRGTQGAVVSMTTQGELLAMVGGRDYQTTSFNRATQALRQPGSAFKPIVYLTALEHGYRAQSAVTDAPITISGWTPRNDSGRFSGNVSLSHALAWSLNTVSVRLTNDVGRQSVIAMARRLGITTNIPNEPSIALGSAEVRPIELVRAYAVIANNGQAVQPFGITKITADGETIYSEEASLNREHSNDPATAKMLVRPEITSQMASMMAGVVAYGTGANAALGRDVAGKTGTTSDNKDGWFVGFSSGVVTGVWMGRDNARPVAGLQGGRAPASAFRSVMRVAVKDRPNLAIGLPSSNSIGPQTTKDATKEDAAPKKSAETTPKASAAAPAPSPVQEGRSRIVPLEG